MTDSQRQLLSMLGGLVLLMTGCINISMRTQPEDTSVKEILRGSDCVVIFLGLGLGTATIEEAKADGHTIETGTNPPTRTPITKVRRVETREQVFLLFGHRCVDVTGE